MDARLQYFEDSGLGRLRGLSCPLSVLPPAEVYKHEDSAIQSRQEKRDEESDPQIVGPEGRDPQRRNHPPNCNHVLPSGYNRGRGGKRGARGRARRAPPRLVPSLARFKCPHRPPE